MIIVTYIQEKINLLKNNILMLKYLSEESGLDISIVEDGEINQDTIDICKTYGLFYRATEKTYYGPAYARNLGISLSFNEPLIFLDVEVIPTYEAVFQVNKVLNRCFDHVLLFRCDFIEKDKSIGVDGRLSIIGKEEVVLLTSQLYVGAACIHKCMFEKTNLFDLDFNKHWGFEDVDLGKRFELLNISSIWFPQIQFFHLYHPPLRNFVRGSTDNYNLFKIKARQHEKSVQENKPFVVNTGDLNNLKWHYNPKRK